MGLILDTSALVTLERCNTDVATVLAPYADEPVVIPVIVWAELLIGARLARTAANAARRRARLERLRQHVPLAEFTDETAEHYADIYAECAAAGTPIPQNDMAVAATARQLGYRVLVGSRDEAHFRSVRGLGVIVLPG